MSAPAVVRLTIGELAGAAGMTVRNVRNHQSRGLLPPPELEGRTGYYGERHLERLRLIRRMQADGFNLEAIRRLLGDAQSRGALEAEALTEAVRRGLDADAALRVAREVRAAFERAAGS